MAPRGPKSGGPVKAVATNGNKLPQRLPVDIILRDVSKNEWRLGRPVGVGGFGEIYLASNKIDESVGEDAAFVVKIEPHKNGPLFTEMHFYHRVGKHELIDEWIRSHRLDYLGMPRFYGSGSHDHKGEKYRFMVMERYGTDLQKILDRSPGHTLSPKTALTVACRVIDVLEYIHSHGYTHADVKGSNLLLGFQRPNDRIYLVDFGLACRYLQSDNTHKEYKEDLRKAHDGTIEFTSRDAHIGAHSRRGDLEILGYNLVQWLSGGRLPWMDCLKDQEEVARKKRYYMSRLTDFMNKCFGKKKAAPGVVEFLKYVSGLSFEDKPDYDFLRKILHQAMKAQNIKNDGQFDIVATLISPVKAAANGRVAAGRRRGGAAVAPPKPKGRPPKRKSTDVIDDEDECDNNNNGGDASSSDNDDDEENLDAVSPLPGKRSRRAPTARAKGTNRSATGGGATRSATPQRNGSASGANTKSRSNTRGRSGRGGSANSSTGNSHTTTMSDSSSCLLGLDNPTPAMVEVMRKRAQQNGKVNGGNGIELSFGSYFFRPPMKDKKIQTIEEELMTIKEEPEDEEEDERAKTVMESRACQTSPPGVRCERDCSPEL